MSIKGLIQATGVLLFAVSPLSFADTQGEQGVINVTGKVVDMTCALDASSKANSLVMGDVASNLFTAKGDKSVPHAFDIVVSGCPDTLTGATVTFMGSTVSGDATTLKTSDFDTTKVGLQIIQNGKTLKLDGSAASEQVAGPGKAGSTITLPFEAVYVATEDAVVSGDTDATLTYVMNYQ